MPATPSPLTHSIHNRGDTWFIDIDGTLYPLANGLYDQIVQRVRQFTADLFGLPVEEAMKITKSYYRQYGNTLSGLVRHHQVDPCVYLDYIHDVPVGDYIQKPEPAIARVLSNLPGRRIVLTNGGRSHAGRVLAALGVDAGLFDLVIDAVDQLPYSKPDPEAFRLALRLAGVDDPGRCALIDDSPANTRTAREIGMWTVLVGEDDPTACDLNVPTFAALLERTGA